MESFIAGGRTWDEANERWVARGVSGAYLPVHVPVVEFPYLFVGGWCEAAMSSLARLAAVSLQANLPGACVALMNCSIGSTMDCLVTWCGQAVNRAFQFGQKSLDSIRFDSRYRIDFFDSIRFGNLINLPLVH